jgi:two-component system, NtrC family, sensor kinase
MQPSEHQQLQEKNVHDLAEVGLLSAGIIHEVKNALQGVANALFLLDHEQGLRPKARTWIADARRELSRAIEVSHETLALVREESVSPIRIHDVLENVLDTYAGKIRYKGVHVERRFEFHETIQADPGAVRQVFANIILNALESAPHKTGKLTIHTSPFLKMNGTNIAESVPANDVRGVRIVFGDNGPGIPEENRKKVFEPLFSTKKGKGTGLGLWMTQKLVHKQHGSVRLRSSSNGKRPSGTCFSVFLPLHQNQPSDRLV